jgi:hypothetical protein
MNVSGNQFRYDYNSLGVYTASFLVENMLGSKIYKLTVSVMAGISTLVLNFPTAISVGSKLTVDAYLVIAMSGVNFTWSFDSNTATTSRICLSFSYNFQCFLI